MWKRWRLFDNPAKNVAAGGFAAIAAASMLCAFAGAADQPGQRGSQDTGAVEAKAEVPGQIKKFHVTAHEGTISPTTLRVNRDDHVQITFVSRDGTYSIKFKDFDISARTSPEKPALVEFVPHEAGTFDFSCTRTFGLKRWNRNGTLIVK